MAAMRDEPKLLGDPDAVRARRALLGEPHVAPLTAYANRLRITTSAGSGVPDFDPWDGGIRAQCLFLLEAPGGRAVGSGFVSRNNPDETAKSFWQLNREAAIPRELTVIWNVVPWYVGAEGRIRAARARDVAMAMQHFEELLDLLPRLRAVVLVGRAAQRAADHVAMLRPQAKIFHCPHPSPRSLNPRPHLRQEIAECLQGVAGYLNR